MKISIVDIPNIIKIENFNICESIDHSNPWSPDCMENDQAKEIIHYLNMI